MSLPITIAAARRKSCAKADCRHLDLIDYHDPCAECPDGHFGTFSCVGLGTRIESLAKPVAGAMDSILGTNIRGCGGCGKMRDRLNQGMPITEAVKLRIKGI